MSKQLTPTSNSCVTMPVVCVRGMWKLRKSVVIYRYLSRSTDVTSCGSTILLSSNWCSPPFIVYNLPTLMFIVTTLASDKLFGLVDRVKGAGRELNGRQRAGSLKLDSHIACRAHAFPLPCRTAKGLECVFSI